MRNKKIMASLLCTALVASTLVGCSKKETPAETTTTQAVETTTAASVAGEAIPDPVYYFSCDQADGTAGIQATGQDKAGDPILYDNGKDIVFIPGAKGDALYTDGSYGYKLTDVNGVGDTFTLSFWVYATRFADYMPSIQFGPDVHGDATGSQHYLNVTRASWGGDPAFPCLWSYDQADGAYWPNWFPQEADEHLKQWLNITLVVDASKTTVDGIGILGDMYVNGELFGSEIPVARGTMSQSDNFDFLLGVNYWDSIFKGAFDEIYIFDKALTAGQALTLFQMGDVNAVFDEPEHEFIVTPNDKAIDTMGTTTYNLTLGEKYFEPVAIKDGQTIEVKLANWSDGEDSKNNYALVFTDGESSDPLKDSIATVYADADGDGTFNYTWGNWKTWSQKVMRDVDVTLKITRDGNTISIQADNVDYNESANTMYATVDVSKASDAAYMYITGQKAYIELLSVKDKTPKANAGVVVGDTSCTTPFWTVFSDIWAVPAGSSKTLHFTNYTSGEANWNNFVAIIQSTPTGHSVDTEGYKEYAVLRADNWGWGDNFANTDADKSCDWDWDTFVADVDGANVDLTVTNDGANVEVEAVFTSESGAVHTQKYTNIAVDGDVYLTLTVDGSYIEFAPVMVGNTDLTTPFWTEFSDIFAVPAGTSKTLNFTNYTSGDANWNNFVAILQSTATGHSVDTEGYKEYAVLRADNWGWGDNFGNTDDDKSCDWDWDTFVADVDGAHVDLTVVNTGVEASVVATITSVDGKVHTQTYKNIAVDGDIYLTLTVDGSYIVFEPATVGNTDCTTPFWTEFSSIWEIAEGTSKTVEFTNYTSGEANWNNFVAIIQSTPTGHSVDTEGYKEYAVVRADNWGWGDNFANTDEDKSCDWDWDTFVDDIDGANVKLTVTNDGANVEIEAVITSVAGAVHTQKYTNIAVDGTAYLTLTVDGSYIVIE